MTTEAVTSVPMVFDGGHSARVVTTHRSCTIRLSDGKLISADTGPEATSDWRFVDAPGDNAGHADWFAPDHILDAARELARS